MTPNKPWTRHTVSALLLALCWLGLSGRRASATWAAEQPSLQGGSPLKGVNPLKVCLKDFQDLRFVKPAAIPEAMSPARYKWPKPHKPVANLIRDSVRREFERDGHTCLGPEQEAKADVVMEGALYQYSVHHSIVGLALFRATCNIGVKLSVRSAKDPEAVFFRKYEGTFYADKWRTSNAWVSSVMNDALFNLIKELTNDEDLLDFLRRQGGVVQRQSASP